MNTVCSRFRQSKAPLLFLGAFQPDRVLIGFVVSTLSSAITLSHESMSSHEAAGTSVCIHSIVVKPSLRRRGIATALLREYVQRVSSEQRLAVDRFLLITHEELRPLYELAGFEWVGLSSVKHGSRDWFEMKLDAIRPPLPPEITQEAVMTALSARPSPRSSGRTLADVGSVSDVIDLKNLNSTKLVCLGCGSTILLPKTCALTEAPSVKVNLIIDVVLCETSSVRFY
jgi:GNAT superfamily N-acetyltransferase